MTDREMLAAEHVELLNQRSVIETEWQRIAEYLLPNLSNITGRGFEGRKKTRKLFDTTGIDALDKLTTLIIGTATSSVVRWFTPTHKDPNINLDYEAQFWFEDTAQKMFDAINDSNYPVAGPETLREYVAFGTGNMFCSEIEHKYNPVSGFRGLFFQGIPIGSYTIQEDGLGSVNQTTREFLMPMGEVIKRWPKGDYSKDSLKLAMEKPWTRMSILHDIRPEGRRYKSHYLLMGNASQFTWHRGHSIKDSEYLHEGGHSGNPCFIPRWDKCTGEVWGFGRGHLALPEIATLNRARQLKLRQWALSVDPPLLAMNDGVVGQPRIVPGAINRINMADALTPLQTGVNFDHASIPESESKLQIRQLFYTEQILQFAPDAKTPPSATEVLQRMEFLHQLLGPSIGRLLREFMTPMLWRVLHLMHDANALLPLPTSFGNTLNGIFFKFEGPLARAQRTDELRAIGDTLAVTSNVATIDPGVWDNFDTDAIVRDSANITGLPKRYLLSEEERDARREEKQAQQAQLQQAQMMQAGAATAKDLGSAQKSFAEAAQTV